MINKNNLKEIITKKLEDAPIYDIHTHIYDESFKDLLLWGIDELLVYHYLLAEAYRYNPIGYERLWAMSKSERAEYVWKTVFIDHTPISESALGLLTCLKEIDCPISRDLNEIRDYFKNFTTSEYIDLVFKTSKVKKCIMTNNPFAPDEYPIWENHTSDPRFETALRIDDLILNYEKIMPKLIEWKYIVSQNLNTNTISEIKRFLQDWVLKINPVYMAASLPPTFTMPEESISNTIITNCILEVCKEINIPFAMMIGVKKLTNPDMQLAGDSVGRSSIDTIEWLCKNYPDNKFLLTHLAREDQHSAIVCARKFANLHIFGCWWFCNNPVIIDDFSRMRIEMLGTSVTLQHSDARVLDQLIYKWIHFKRILGNILIEKYSLLLDTGWQLKEEEINRDIADVLGGAFTNFIKR